LRKKNIFGDLANMLKVRKFRDYRHQVFTTDLYGFRNKQYPSGTNFQVVVAGDSDMAGSSLSDLQIFSSKLAEQLEVNVFNYAPWSPRTYLKDRG